jgi:DNA processing protein
VPGSPLDPRAAGSNDLLKQGVPLVTEARDVIDHMTPLLTHRTPPLRAEEPPPPDFGATAPPDDDDRARVVEALGPTPVGIDEIIRQTELHPAQVFMILLELDLARRLERHAGGKVSLILSER